MRLLDLGCGPGFTSARLAELIGEGGRVIGLDRSPRFRDYFAALHAGDPRLQFVRGDVTRLDDVLPPASFAIHPIAEAAPDVAFAQVAASYFDMEMDERPEPFITYTPLVSYLSACGAMMEVKFKDVPSSSVAQIEAMRWQTSIQYMLLLASLLSYSAMYYVRPADGDTLTEQQNRLDLHMADALGAAHEGQYQTITRATAEEVADRIVQHMRQAIEDKDEDAVPHGSATDATGE